MKRVTALGAMLALLLAPVLVRLLKAQSPSAPPPPPPTYTLTDLGSLNGGSWIDQENVRRGPTALNANAQVAGFRLNLAFGDQPIGFLWDKGTFTDLGTGGGPQSYAYGINDAGQIVGTSNFVASSNFPGDLTGNSSRAFIYQNGVMTILDPDPNNWSRAYAINRGGDVAGFIATSGSFPAIWKAGGGRTMLTSLPCSLPACQGEALAINDLGQAAGVSVGGNVNAFRPVMWDTNGQPTDLIPEPGDPGTSEANGINNNGVVIGYYQPQPSINNLLHAFRWQNGVFTDLGTMGTDTYSGAWGIDSKGDIVGTSATTFGPILGGDGGRAFLYIVATQTMYDLTTLVPGTNWRLNAGYAINDNGQIVGIGVAPDGSVHGFLLTPVITPTTTTVATSVNPSVFGQQVSFTATVTPAPPNANAVNDTVTFKDGATTLGNGTYNGNGIWIFNTTAPLSVGTHSITASYNGDNNFAASTSTALTQTVGQAGTVTSLSASANTPSVGLMVTFTATVTVAAPGAGTPTGAVTFLANGAPLTCTGGNQTVSAGQATCQYAFGTAGAESITASYGGDTNFTGSTGTSGITVTAQGPPPPVPIMVNETITVTDTASFPDVYDAEAVHVADAVFVTPLIQVTAPVAEFSAGTLGFSGQSGSQTIAVSDIGTASLSIASATISGSPQFAITQIACSNGATSASTALPSGGVCILTIGYSASATPANDNATVVFTDNAALSNVLSTQAGSSYTQSIALSGSGTSTPPPPPPPAVIPVVDNETIFASDTPSFPDVFDSETITVTDQVSIQVLNPTSTSISVSGAVFGNGVTATVLVSSATATVTGNVTLTLDGGPPATMTLSSGSATFNLGSLSLGPHVLAANFPAQGNFLTSSAGMKFTVTPATPAISWKNPAPITFGTALSSSQLNALASVPGTFIYSPAAGTVLNAGTQTLSVTFTPTDTTDYTTASASVTLTVNQAVPGLVWPPPSPITVGTPLSGAQLNATASVPGTLLYSPGPGTLLNVGTQALSVVFTPADAVDYMTAAASVVLTVTPAITSGNSTTFTEGAAGSFTVTTAGTPTPSLTLSGTPPSGVTFTDNANGTGTLSGTPAIGTSGTYALTFTGTSNGTSVSQSFTLTVNSGVAITSGSTSTFTEQVPGFFLVTTTGSPAPSLMETGPLPKGVLFTDNGNGTATLSGTPAAGTSGSYPIKIVANNGVGTGAGQAFTLTVNAGAAITSGSSTTFTEGSAGWFTVTTTGSPTPALTETGTLPGGVTFVDNGDSTGTLAGTPAPGSAGTYPLIFIATNSVDKPAMQSFTLTVNQGPAITSGSATTFTVGAAGAFLVTTTGFPAPSLKEVGILPTGVTFVDNGDGTAILSGTPAAGTGGSYPLTITAANGVDTNSVQTFALTVDQGLAITSGSMTTFTVGSQGWFSVTTSGFPVPTISETGTLPTGVTFTDNGNGTATLAGIPPDGTGGNYGLTIKASNGGVTPDVSQSFTLTVNQGPAILTGNSTTFTVGVAGSFTVMTSGFPTPAITQTGTLPSGLTLTDNGDGTATLSGTPAAGTGGSYPLTLTATNGVDTPAMQTFTLVINQGPAITSSNTVTFNELAMSSFTVTATGNPIPAMTEVGNLPNGVTFVDNGDGTAFLGGIPAAASGGQYGFTITASNGVLPNATQTFTLTVVPVLTFTSPSNAHFTVGVQNLFTITTAGTPLPTVAHFGTLPAGITFTALSNGTATLSGVPQGGTEGSYPITFTATNANGARATQAFILVVGPPANDSAPVITSANHTTFASGLKAGDGITIPYNFFKVTTTGFPVPKLTAKFGTAGSTVPYFHDNGDGTATISFAPGPQAVGTTLTTKFTITATGPDGLTATQLFTLSVVSLGLAPKFTSANQVGFVVGVPNTFTVAAGPFVDQITAGSLPNNIHLTDNHDGTATLSGTPGQAGNTSAKFTFTASNPNLNTAVHPKAYTATQTFTLVFLP